MRRRRLQESARHPDSGVVHQDVDHAVLVVDLCGKRIDRFLVADIGLVRDCPGAGVPDRRRGVLRRGQVTVDDHDGVGALARQFQGGGAADPGAGTGDQGEFASHVARTGSHRALCVRSGAVDDSVDPFTDQPRDDVGTRGHHPVAAFDRNDPAAQRD